MTLFDVDYLHLVYSFNLKKEQHEKCSLSVQFMFMFALKHENIHLSVILVEEVLKDAK